MAKPRRYGYCIGINYEGTVNALNGCRADADNLAAVMRGRGFGSVDVYYHCTAGEFFDTLDWYAKTLRPSDTLVITYSGHGTQIYDPTQPREADWYDEAICLWDSETGIQAVTDDAIQSALRKVRGSVFFISDSCYAGGLDRSGAAAMVGEDYRTKYIPFDPETMQVIRPKEIPPTSENPFQRVYQLFACAEEEVSYDTSKGGVFTNALIKNYRAGVKGVGKLIDKCVIDLNTWQTPRLAPVIRGTKARYLF